MVLVMLKCSALLIIAALLSALLARASASTRRCVLGASVIGVLTVPILSLILPSWDVVSLEPQRELPPAAAKVLLPATVELASEPVDRTIEGAPGPALGSTGSVGIDPPRASDSRSFASLLVSSMATLVASISWQTLVMAFWFLGFGVLVGRLGAGLLVSFRLGYSGAGSESELWEESLKEAAEELGLLRCRVELRFNSAVDVPMAIGIVRPMICLPLEALDWSLERRRMVLLHELAHIKNYDNILNLLGQLLRAIHWFNPFAWWIVRRVAVENEHAADDIVLGAGTRASDYAFELVYIVRDGQPGLAAVSAMARPAELKSRVMWILNRGCHRKGWTLGQRLAFWSVGLVVLGLLSCASVVRESPESVTAAGASSNEGLGSPRFLPLAGAVADYYGVAPFGVELTIDEPLQSIVDDEVRELVERYQPRSVSVIALDPCTGYVLALGSHGDGGAARSMQAFQPGSTMKPITIAAALEEGMSAEARFFCENGSWHLDDGTIHDSRASGWLDVSTIISRSSNIGTGRIYQGELGWDRLRSWLTRFHFGERPSLQLYGIEAGSVPASERSTYHGVLVSNGIGMSASAVQIASAYATLANDGVYNPPTLARRVSDQGGRVLWEHSPEDQQIVSEFTAESVLEMLGEVVASDLGTERAARVPGLEIAGKTGTVQLASAEPGNSEVDYYASFVGIVEPEDPQVVILIGVEGPQGDGITGGQVAAPAFARIVSRARAESDHIE